MKSEMNPGIGLLAVAAGLVGLAAIGMVASLPLMAYLIARR